MKQAVEQAIAAAIKSLFDVDIEPVLTRPDEQFGDYATNCAMQLAGRLGKNPREIAEALAVKLRENIDLIRSVDIAGPGFLNLTLQDALYHAELNDHILAHEGSVYGNSDAYKDKIIVTEYSDPNPFKPLHAGHLYTTLVGDTISRLIEKASGNVTRINYGGDVGMHVGKTMWSIVQFLGGELPDKLADVPDTERPEWLGARYVEGNTAYEENDESKQQIIATNKRVYQVHAENDHDSAFAKIYWTCRGWSYEYFDQLYAQLQVHPFDRVIPESEVTPLGLATVREQLEKGVYKESDGAVIFEGEPFGLHTRVFINSEGLPTYEAKDVGLLLTKWNDYHYDRSIYITANEQAQYMAVMFKSVEQFAPEPALRSQHLTHGIVKLAGGAKMSSRTGNVVRAVDILDAATEAAHKLNENSTNDTVLGAVKYAFLKNRIGGDILYDPNESVSLEGNSGPYLQYAYVRAISITKKQTTQAKAADWEFEPGERNLVRKLTEYPEVIEKAVAELMPHHVCTYLYQLAQAFNRFYENNRVIGDDREALRLQLVTAYAGVLHNGLTLLGIPTPDKM
jgi:arginyl-tRNA synthetase